MRITSLAFLVYTPLAVGALGWAWFGQGRQAWVYEPAWIDAPPEARVVLSLGLGLALAAVVVGTTPALIRRAAWARALHEEMRPIIEPLSPKQIHFLALSSGFAEELFFRGAMQPVLGLVVTSAVFGAVHTGPKRVFFAWSLWAFLMGLLFGMMFEATGSLWGPVLAHVLINDRNLTYLRGH